MIIDYTVSIHFRNVTFERFPALIENERHRNMFLYQLFPYYDPDDNMAIIPATLIASIEGVKWSKDYSAITFLEEYRNAVLPGMQWYTWSKRDGKSRRIVDNGWGDDYDVLIKQEKLGAFDSSGKVWFLSGKAVTNKSVIATRNTRKVEAMCQIEQNAHNEDMQFIAEYMNNTPVNTFTKTIKRNMDSAKIAATDIIRSEYKPAREKEIRVFAHTMSVLRALETYPQDHYTAVEGGTSRLFAITAGIQNLPRKVRKALTKGWIECDLCAAQTAINARLWNVENVHTFLATGASIWKTIADDIGFELTEATKEAIKKAFYRLQFGGRISTVKAEFTTRMNNAGYEIAAERFVNHWIVKDMLEGRDAFVAEMVKNNGAGNYYGQWFSLDTYDYKTILSHIATSYEMALIRPVFDIAVTSDDFLVVLYQFDGFSIHVIDKSKEQQILNRIHAAINKKACMLDINTKLEHDYVL